MKYHFFSITLAPNLRIGNHEGEALASRDRKLELPKLSSQAGAGELASSINIGFRLALAHAQVDTLFDPIIILSVGLMHDGKKQLPFGMLVGRMPNACRSGDLKECVYVSC